jgi:hypothetical protein
MDSFSFERMAFPAGSFMFVAMMYHATNSYSNTDNLFERPQASNDNDSVVITDELKRMSRDNPSPSESTYDNLDNSFF